MDLDAATLWFATRSESSLKHLKGLGVTKKLLNGEPTKLAWEFIHDYQSKHGGVPAASILFEQTGAIIKPPTEGDEEVAVSFVVDLLFERAEYKALTYGLGKSSEALEQGDQVESVSEVLRLADHLRKAKAEGLQIHSLGEVAPDVLAMYERVKAGETGVPFPWQIMTEMTLGMWPGTLTFFVARPGVGKTWTAVIIAEHVAFEANRKVLIVSPELGRVELAERFVAKHGSFAYKDMVSATLGDMAEKQLRKVVAELHAAGTNVFILDNEERLEPGYIEAAIEAIEPDLLEIDSIYMLRVAEGKIKKGPGSQGDRRERIVDTVNWMRTMSRRSWTFAPEGLAVMGISQLSRTGKVSAEASKTLKAGRGTGGLEDAVAISDELFWASHNLFAMYQDEYMRQDKQLLYVPLKARRQAKMCSLVVKWDLDEMDFSEIGTRVIEQDDYEDTDGSKVPY